MTTDNTKQDELRHLFESAYQDGLYPNRSKRTDLLTEKSIKIINSEVLSLLEELEKEIDAMQPDPDYYHQAIKTLKEKYK